MTSFRPLRTAALALVAVFTVGAPAPAEAGVPGARLLLTIRHGDSVVDPISAVAVLTCLPPGGSHPHPRTACAALLAADGDFGRLRPVRGEMCPQLIDPVTVTATGTWLHRPVGYARTFANRCVAARRTGDVFAF